jgi:hypothetical protein
VDCCYALGTSKESSYAMRFYYLAVAAVRDSCTQKESIPHLLQVWQLRLLSEYFTGMLLRIAAPFRYSATRGSGDRKSRKGGGGTAHLIPDAIKHVHAFLDLLQHSINLALQLARRPHRCLNFRDSSPSPLIPDYKRSVLPKTPTSFIMRNATNPFSTSIPSHAHPPSLPPTAPPTVARAWKPKQLCFLQHANGHDKDPSLQSRSSKSFANSTVFADPWLFGKRGT